MTEGYIFSLSTIRGVRGDGSQVSDFFGGGAECPRSQIFSGGVPGLRFFRREVPGLRFFGGGVPGLRFLGVVPVSVKGKIFDTRFGLIHVQTGKKIFCRGTPPPVKGKIFDTRFGLIHVQTGKKNFVEGPPPRNSKKLLWLRGGRYASCVHAGGLSCSVSFDHGVAAKLLSCR